MGKNRAISVLTMAFTLLILGASTTVAAEPVEVNCSVKGHGNVVIEIKINHPGVKGLILKATLPKGVELLSAKPKARGAKDGIVKWFIDARSRQKIEIKARFSKEVRESDLAVEAIFKMPGKEGMTSVRAR